MTIDYAILSLFAMYGMISLFINIYKSIGKRKYFVENANIVLLVNNQEQNIERMIREAMESRFVRNIAINGSFIVVDMDSKDDTLKLLKKLENQFPLMEVCSFDERECVFLKEKENHSAKKYT